MANSRFKKTTYHIGQEVVFRIRGSPERAIEKDGQVNFFIAMFEVKSENTIIKEEIFLPMSCLDSDAEALWDSNIKADATFRIRRIFHKNEPKNSIFRINKAKGLGSADWICFMEYTDGSIIRCPLYLIR